MVTKDTQWRTFEVLRPSMSYNVPSVHPRMFSIAYMSPPQPLYAPLMCLTCTPYVSYAHHLCALCTPLMHLMCTPYAHPLHALCTLLMCLMHTTYVPYTPHLCTFHVPLTCPHTAFAHPLCALCALTCLTHLTLTPAAFWLVNVPTTDHWDWTT